MYADGGETVICLSNHLTSFAVLVDTAGTTPVSIYSTQKSTGDVNGYKLSLITSCESTIYFNCLIASFLVSLL